jgi:hypothetical protein
LKVLADVVQIQEPVPTETLKAHRDVELSTYALSVGLSVNHMHSSALFLAVMACHEADGYIHGPDESIKYSPATAWIWTAFYAKADKTKDRVQTYVNQTPSR